jgi:cell division protein ZapA
MDRRTVQLRVAGQSYRVVTTANDHELERCIQVIEQRLGALTPRGRPITPQSILLAAISLAHELDQERARADRIQANAREALTRLLERVDAALDEDSSPAPPPTVTMTT